MTSGNERRRYQRSADVTAFFFGLGLRLAGVRIRIDGSPPPPGRLFVANHVSFIDVGLMSAVQPMTFVTSREMRQNTALGPLCILGGCVFVDRQHPARLRREISEIGDLLKRGFSVAVFPEARTSDGSQLLRFRSPLFDAAIQSKKLIQPVCIQYIAIDDRPFGRGDADRIFYFEGKRFFAQLWHLFQARSVECRVTVLPPLKPDVDRKELAAQAQKSIDGPFVPIN